MALLSLKEAIDIVIMVLAVGFIFMDYLIPHQLKGFRRVQFPQLRSYHFDWKIFRLAVYITAPALIAHELAHKFVAMSFGHTAQFVAMYGWLAFGVVLRLIHSPFIFLIPGGVLVPAKIPAMEQLIIAGSGPFLNLVLYLASWGLIKAKGAKMKPKTFALVQATKVLNLFWFVLNMLPFPGSDGWKVYTSIYGIFK